MRSTARTVVWVAVAVALGCALFAGRGPAGAAGTTTTTGATSTTTTAPGSSSTAQSVDLGGLDMDNYCDQTTNSTAVLLKGSVEGPDDAYDNWACESNDTALNMTSVCQWSYQSAHPGQTIVAYTASADDAYDWTCYLGAAPTTPPVTTGSNPSSTVVAGGGGGQEQVRYLANPPSPLAASIGTPGEIFHSPTRDLVNALIAGAAVLLIAFPANIFNQTLSDHYDEILEWIAVARRKARSLVGLRDAPTPAPATAPAPATEPSTEPSTEAPTTAGPLIAPTTPSTSPGKVTPPWFIVTLALGALLGGFLDPSFGLNGSSLENLIGTFCAFAVGAVVSCYVGLQFRRRHGYPVELYLRALPLGLVVALAGVVISRLTSFQPGYLYGVVVGISFVGGVMPDHHTGKLVTFSTLTTLGVGLTAWLLWIPVNHLALESGANIVEVVLDDVLGAIFMGSLFGTVINLLPLHELPGGHLSKWRREVWAGVMFLALFLLVAVELHPAGGPSHPGGAAIATVVILFVGFGGLSLGLREYFRRRQREAAPQVVASVAPAAAEEPAD